MKEVRGPADAKPGDPVRYSAPYRSGRITGNDFDGTVVKAGATTLVVKDTDGKRRTIAYETTVTTTDFRRTKSTHYNFCVLDARDLWIRDRPKHKFQTAQMGPKEVSLPIYSFTRDALINHHDDLIAEIGSLRAWFLGEPPQE